MGKLPGKWRLVLVLLSIAGGEKTARAIAERTRTGYGVTCLLLEKMKAAGLVVSLEVGGSEDSPRRVRWTATVEGLRRLEMDRMEKGSPAPSKIRGPRRARR